MRRIAISFLSFFVAGNAFAGASLPVVNVAAASVSARAAFGEEIVTPKKQKTLRTRPASKQVAKSDAARNTQTGQTQIAAAATDVLVPRRPAGDLWARNDAALRMPRADEFSVIRADYELPEEDIDTTAAHNAAPVTVASAETVAQIAPVAPASTPMSEIDAQIARLVELQKRADDSVTAQTADAPRATAQVSDKKIAMVDATPAIQTVAADVTAPTNVRRMIVPQTDAAPRDDVIVRTVEKNTAPRIAAATPDISSSMSPSELRRAFKKTFLSENKHLSAYQIDDRFDVVSDMTTNAEGFTARRDLSESGGIRPLEIKIKFRDDDAALSRDNYNLLTEYAGIVLSNPTRAIQVSIPQSVATNMTDRKVAARRLAIIEQVLRDTGISEHRIMPVLSQRDSDGFVLRMISNDQYETLTQQKRDMFGDAVGKKKSYTSMTW